MNGDYNIYALDAATMPASDEPELFQTLACGSGRVRIERIVSTGQTTPEGEWFDQDWDEWVVVLEGEARLRYMDGREVEIRRGESLLLPRRRKHRVVHTSSPCIWLAVHADSLSPEAGEHAIGHAAGSGRKGIPARRP